MKRNDIVLLSFQENIAHYVILQIVGERIHLENIATGRRMWEYLSKVKNYNPCRIGQRYSFLGFKFDLYYQEESI